MSAIRLVGWLPGFNKIGLNYMLRSNFEMSLSEAKRMVDMVLEKECVKLVVHPEDISLIVAKLEELKVCYELLDE